MITEILKIKDVNKDREKIKKAAHKIREGGLVVIPTETVYGLGASALNPIAVKNIFKAKGRPQDNPLIVHLSDISGLDKVCKDIPDSAYRLFERFSPGPLTVVLKRKDIIPDIVSAGLESIAVRIPSSIIAREIIKESGVPVAAPSANISGKPSPTTAQHVISEMTGRVDIIVDGGPCDVGVESTVISLLGEKPILLRPGGITKDELQSVLGDIDVSRSVLSKLNDNEKVYAPGMKYRHYAPKAKLVVVKGFDDDVREFIRLKVSNAIKDGINPGVLCFDGEEGYFSGAITISYGRPDMPETLAHSLFMALRAFDETDVEVIYARSPEPSGIGLAVYNRLIKAAGFNIIDV